MTENKFSRSCQGFPGGVYSSVLPREDLEESRSADSYGECETGLRRSPHFVRGGKRECVGQGCSGGNAWGRDAMARVRGAGMQWRGVGAPCVKAATSCVGRRTPCNWMTSAGESQNCWLCLRNTDETDDSLTCSILIRNCVLFSGEIYAS